MSGMAAQSSFDITSTIDFQEVDNALNQARKEIGQRYDFKGAKADIDLNAAEKKLALTAEDEFGSPRGASQELQARGTAALRRRHG